MTHFKRLLGVKFYNIQHRCLCTKQIREKTVNKYVYISQSSDIYTNLALEDWLHTKTDFTNQEILMLWKSTPCVVIGKFQNPWIEANVDQLSTITADGVKLARRNSGGGTVYHDEGNLNLTFFSSRDQYNRERNLRVIKRALFKEYQIKAEITERKDLVVRDYKISGTASNLGRLNAYHHCTLLIDSNKNHIHQTLSNTLENVETRASKSTRSKILNLKEENPHVKFDSVLKAVGLEFLQTPAKPSPAERDVKITTVDNGFHLVNPTETWYPGINAIRDKLSGREFIFGLCPEFTVSRNIDVNISGVKAVTLKMMTEKGRISDIKLEGLGSELKAVYIEEQILSEYQNKEFSSQIVNNIHISTSNLLSDIIQKERDRV